VNGIDFWSIDVVPKDICKPLKCKSLKSILGLMKILGKSNTKMNKKKTTGFLPLKLLFG